MSDQLNTLRSLLETRLQEQNEIKRQMKDASILQSSPGTFTKDFLHSFEQTKHETRSTELVSDLDDEDPPPLGRHLSSDQYEKCQSDALSTSNASSHQHGYLLASPFKEPSGERTLSLANHSPASTNASNLAIHPQKRKQTLTLLT